MYILVLVLLCQYFYSPIFSILRLAAITIHSFTPTLDPVAPVSLLDKISYWMGVHEKSAIVILDVGAWSTIVYTYIFHRHVSDGSFHIEKEYKNTILPGLFSDEVAADKTLLTRKIDDILSQAVKNLPNSVFRQGPLKKWTEHSQELNLLKIHSRGAPITSRGWMGVDFLDHELL